MSRRLFCQLSPLAYRISAWKERSLRRAANLPLLFRFAQQRQPEPLPVLLYRHASLIRRTLGEVNPVLQDNKAVNLALAAPKISGVLIRPGQIFSFWALVGNCTARAGYREGLFISMGKPARGIGGGLCQFTNLLHWMVLHSPLTITEHHHHNGVDLFPDYKRQVPFGVGTSILYNYLDYRFQNNTDTDFQLIVSADSEYLRGELRCGRSFDFKYHITAENEFFRREPEGVFRCNEIVRRKIDKRTGNELSHETLLVNHARICYDESLIPPDARVESSRIGCRV